MKRAWFIRKMTDGSLYSTQFGWVRDPKHADSFPTQEDAQRASHALEKQHPQLMRHASWIEREWEPESHYQKYDPFGFNKK